MEFKNSILLSIQMKKNMTYLGIEWDTNMFEKLREI